MKRIDVPRLLISGLSAGVGKTTLMLAVLYELRRRGVQVAAAVTAPNLQVCTVFERLTGRPVGCLDPALLTRQQLMEGLDRISTGAELVLIDGSRGILDTDDGKAGASDAELAILTHTPVLLVTDVRNQGSTLAAAVRGVQLVARGIEWAGVALNRLETSFEGRSELIAAFGRFNAVPPLVALPNLDPVPPVLSNGVQQIRNATLLDRSFLTAAADSLTRGSDLEQLIARASAAPALECELPEITPGARVRVAVARDSCFCLLFQDNIEILRRHGAEMVEFSPLTDAGFPRDIDGVYLPGGYLGEYGVELAFNESLRAQFAAFLAAGGGLYAEGSSVAYLGTRYRSTTLDGEFPGVGVLNAVAAPRSESTRACRAEGALIESGAVGEAGDLVKGLYPFDWGFDRDPAASRILRVEPSNNKPLLEGFTHGANSFMSFGFWHFGSAPAMAATLLHSFSLNSSALRNRS
jgi:cobyrinic acid a,c-diamide synthase